MSDFFNCMNCHLKWTFAKKVCQSVGKVLLGQPRLFSGHIAPLLHDRLLHLPWVGPRPGAHLLRHVHALLDGLELGHQLGHVLASSLWFEGALLFGGVLHYRLHFVVALQGALVYVHSEDGFPNKAIKDLLEAASSRGAELSRLLGAASDRSVLPHRLLRHPDNKTWKCLGPKILSVFKVDDQPADLSRPLLALGGCCVSRSVWLALLLHLGIHILNKNTEVTVWTASHLWM